MARHHMIARLCLYYGNRLLRESAKQFAKRMLLQFIIDNYKTIIILSSGVARMAGRKIIELSADHAL